MGRKSTASFYEEPVNYVLNPLRAFAVDSYRLIVKCTKPDAKGRSLVAALDTSTFIESYIVLEFKKIVLATSVGFLVMGFTGFFIKLIHIPINNILVGSGA